MDDIVKQALLKWPNVPDCWGWLGLDMRGNWWLRDAQVQAEGPFPIRKGNLVEHTKLIDFIGRNYQSDAHGQWFFQNGPQCVYVELESTPVVWRFDSQGKATSHTGCVAAVVEQCLMDEKGCVYLVCDGVIGIVHSQDVLHVAQMLESGPWDVQEVLSSALPSMFGFVLSPQQQMVQGTPN